MPGLCFALFAVLEHVNHFHTQLMYDTAEDRRALRENGLRRAHPARDLDRGDGRRKSRLGAPTP
ncbi:hypothetical protein SNS2_1565 [Streptomyces netropsis]|uniref:Uncharacterized protein n=1 Tax=Streptomyces syringium TaxID=76729 RepID=A0ABS4Y2G8_9ACTN|nr:hypothetical protein [Streptomyces syringium]MBP2402953.1 hypothetical protein [Streptomyces syringium]SPE51891.1 hypothetical protein SNS2_1565 [Streptomyces netropsis]